mmetsp:Transcript_61284/g.197482  ORF Transcript_61284/g.197482 Transcript_61284/m.197482 type:complete len:209 (-) Transcript_61284:1512-2138(-)
MHVLTKVRHGFKMSLDLEGLLEVKGHEELVVKGPEQDVREGLRHLSSAPRRVGHQGCGLLRLEQPCRGAPVACQRAGLEEQGADLRAKQPRHAAQRQGAVQHEEADEVHEVMRVSALRQHIGQEGWIQARRRGQALLGARLGDEASGLEAQGLLHDAALRILAAPGRRVRGEVPHGRQARGPAPAVPRTHVAQAPQPRSQGLEGCAAA